MPHDQTDAQLILSAGAESDGVNVYVRFDGDTRLYRAEYIANAGFEADDEYEQQVEMNSKEPWTRNLNLLLKTIRIPWHCFSFIRLSPAYAEQILAIQRDLCNEQGGDPIFLASSRKVGFLEDT